MEKVDLRRRRIQGVSGKVLAFDQWRIATGSKVRRLDVPGANQSVILYLRRTKDSQAIHAQIKRGRRAVVVGSDFMGMEVGSVLPNDELPTAFVVAVIGVTPSELKHEGSSLFRIGSGRVGQ